MSRLLSHKILPILFLALAAMSAVAAPELGQSAPDLVAQELDGTTFDLSALRGQVVVINIWATWCGPCRAEMPMLADFYRRFHSLGVAVLALSADSTRDEAAVRKVMAEFPYPAALLNRATRNGFGPARIVPITYLIDRQGVLRAKFWGGGTPLTEQDLEKAVMSLLATPDAARDISSQP